VSDHACGTDIASSDARFASKPGSFGTKGTVAATAVASRSRSIGVIIGY
jgi:hypothetical protein